jgi:hypothetical protein
MSFTTQVSQMTYIDGEFRLLGRVGNETGTLLADFGSTPEKAVSINGGGPVETQYMDGFKVSVISNANMSMNVDLLTPVDLSMVPQGTISLCEDLIRNNQFEC